MPAEKGMVAGPLRAAEQAVGKTTEKLEQLLEQSEEATERLRDLVFFRQIRRMGSRSKKFFVLLIASAMILYWRGVWALYDLLFDYVLPEHRVTGAVVSMIVGALILVGTGKLVDTLAPVTLEEEVVKELGPGKIK